jgi:hypothetical protein
MGSRRIGMGMLGRFRFEFEEAEDGGLIVRGELSGPGGDPIPFGPIVLAERQVDAVLPLVQNFFDLLGATEAPG